MIWRIFYYASAESEIERKRIIEADTIERAIEILIEKESPYFYSWSTYEPLKVDYSEKKGE